MSPLPPAVRPPVDPFSGPDPECRVNNVAPTSAIFAAVLERLNRTSTVSLFQKLTQEIDEHCRNPGGTALLTLLRETQEQHRSEIALMQKQLSDLQALSAKSQSEFEARIKQIEVRLAREVATRERPARRGWLLTALLLLLIGGLCVLIGLLLGRRSFSQPSPAVSCSGGGTYGRTGVIPASGSGVSAAGSGGAIMEAELKTFLKEPGDKKARAFVMAVKT